MIYSELRSDFDILDDMGAARGVFIIGCPACANMSLYIQNGAEDSATFVLTPTGYEAIIDDKTGAYLDTYDLSWGEFLARQMLHRINFKYTQSSTPPSPMTLSQLTEIAAETVQGYDFQDFTAVRFTDLETGKKRSFDQAYLNTLEITPPPPPGKLHHIKFKIGAPEEE